MTNQPPRSRIKWWLRVGISVGLLALCFSLVRPGELVDALAQTSPWHFLAAFALNAVGTILVKAWIAHLTTQASGLSLGFGELVRINLIARFYTLALPRGASTAIRWHHYRKGGSGHAAAALLMFENVVSIFTLFLSAALILGIEAGRAGPAAQWLLPLSWAGSLASAVMLLLFLHQPSARLFRRLLLPLLKRSSRFSGLIGRLLDAIDSYQAISVRRIGSIFFASLLGYAFFVLSAWVLAEGMAIGVGLAAIAWIRSVTLLVALIPVTVAGIGLREGAIIALLSDYGVAPSVAFAYAIASFAIQLVLGLIGATLEALRVLGEKGKTTEGSNGGVQ